MSSQRSGGSAGDPVVSSDDEAQRYPYWVRNGRVMPVANMLTSMGFSVFVPFLPLMVQSLGVHDHLETWVGNMMLLFYVISFASGPVWGGIADHYGRKIMVLRAMLGMGILMCLVPLAPTPGWFVFLFSLVGFCNGSSAAAQALLVANTPPGKIGSTLARLQTGMLTGQTMGPALATMAVAVVSRPHWLFWISSSLLLIAGLLVIFQVREVKQLAPGPWRPQWLGSLRELMAVPRIGVLYLLSFVFAILGAGNITILSVYVLQLQGADASAAGSGAFWVGAVATGLAISSVLSLLLWGRMLDRLDPSRVLIWATAAAGLTQLPLLFLDTPLELVLARAAFGLGASLMQPCIVRLLRLYAPAGMDARAISYNTSFHFIAIGLAPFCAGLIGPVFGLRAYFALTVVFTFFALAVWLRSARRPAGAQ
jgi:DHA1 family multidrug resistance protein-like MFS transporter